MCSSERLELADRLEAIPITGVDANGYVVARHADLRDAASSLREAAAALAKVDEARAELTGRALKMDVAQLVAGARLNEQGFGAATESIMASLAEIADLLSSPVRE